MKAFDDCLLRFTRGDSSETDKSLYESIFVTANHLMVTAENFKNQD